MIMRMVKMIAKVILENSENTLENSEKHSMEFGEIQVKTKKGPPPNLV